LSACQGPADGFSIGLTLSFINGTFSAPGPTQNGIKLAGKLSNALQLQAGQQQLCRRQAIPLLLAGRL